MFQISATLAWHGVDLRQVCCFDPTVVIARLREAFPAAEVLPQDFAWKDRDAFLELGAPDGAVRVAENDALRRGPIWVFDLPVPGGPPVRGKAERYCVGIWSEEPIPEPLRSQFIEFVHALRFIPEVEIKSVRIEGNNEYPS